MEDKSLYILNKTKKNKQIFIRKVVIDEKE